MVNPSRRQAVLRDLGDGDVGLWCAYEDKDRAKELPGARWDPSLKAWRINTRFRREVERVVDELNGGIDQELRRGLAIMFGRLPERLRQPTYRALTKVWHPDLGGDHAASAALNDVWSSR